MGEIGTASPAAQARKEVPGGTVHPLPADLRQALSANGTALAAWRDITPLARNEFICWVEDAKQERTRQRRIRVAEDKLERGERRPCWGQVASAGNATASRHSSPCGVRGPCRSQAVPQTAPTVGCGQAVLTRLCVPRPRLRDHRAR